MSIPQIIWKVRPNGFLHHKFVLTDVRPNGLRIYHSRCTGIVWQHITMTPEWEVRTDAPTPGGVDWCARCGPKPEVSQ